MRLLLGYMYTAVRFSSVAHLCHVQNLMEWNDWSAVTTRRCWPDQDTLPGPSQPQLPGIDVKQCDDRKFGGGKPRYRCHLGCILLKI